MLIQHMTPPVSPKAAAPLLGPGQRNFLRKLVAVNDDEIDTLLHGFSALFCILASYFLLLPLRDEAGVSLGTGALPSLFTASFALTFLATPAASIFLSRPGVTPEKAVQQLYRILALSLLGFFVLYVAVAPPAGTFTPGDAAHAPSGRRLLTEGTPSGRQLLTEGTPTLALPRPQSPSQAVGGSPLAGLPTEADTHPQGPARKQGGPEAGVGERKGTGETEGAVDETLRPNSSFAGGPRGKGLAPGLSKGSAGTALGLRRASEGFAAVNNVWRQLGGMARVPGFSLWGKWAGIRELPSRKSGTLSESGIVSESGSLPENGTLSESRTLPESAALSDSPHEPKRGLTAQGGEPVAGGGKKARDVRAGDRTLSVAQRAVRMSFFVWLSMQNLIAISTMWARMADVFGSDAATRLFGFLGAGATCGQLVGSVLSAGWAQALRFGSGEDVGGRGAVLQIAPLLLSAFLLEAAGHAAAQLRRLTPLGLHSKGKGSEDLDRIEVVPRVGAPRRMWRALLGSFGRLYEGFQLIAASGYLTHICIYMVLSTTIASFLYFEKSMVVASASESAASRMALFATINSFSAVVIAFLQIAATGRLLQRLGLSLAMAASPCAAGVLLLGIAVWPSPRMVGTAEVLRKVVGYTLAKPAREVLFTVTTREEKYKAKICIDTLILRAGDTLAAGLFHVLDGVWQMGPSGCASAAFPLCVACAIVAYSLGKAHRDAAARLPGGPPERPTSLRMQALGIQGVAPERAASLRQTARS